MRGGMLPPAVLISMASAIVASIEFNSPFSGEPVGHEAFAVIRCAALASRWRLNPFGVRNRPNGAILVKTNTDEEPETQLVCGRLRFDHPGQNLVLSALPESKVIVMRRSSILS